MGSTFKSKGFSPHSEKSSMPKDPRLKGFSSDNYAYKILPPKSDNPVELKNRNQIEQLKETNLIQTLVGEEQIETYLQKSQKLIL